MNFRGYDLSAFFAKGIVRQTNSAPGCSANGRIGDLASSEQQKVALFHKWMSNIFKPRNANKTNPYSILERKFYEKYNMGTIGNSKFDMDAELAKLLVKKSNPIFGTYIRQDLTLLQSSRDYCFDFVLPTSLEFRGINDLYSMVMLKLLFIFLFLLAICVFQGVRAGYAYINQWDKVREALVSERRLLPLTKLWFIISEEEAKKKKEWSYKNLGMGSHESILVNPFWVYFRSTSEKETNYRGLDSVVGSKIRNFYLKIDSVFSSNSYWVYHSKLEFLWTFFPCIVLLVISLPSFTLALSLDETHKPAVWFKVIGNQWFWVYEYSGFRNNVTIYSNIVYGADLNDNALRVVEADCVVTLINNRFNRLLITSADVIHCFAVPNLGIKVDACPGRINAVSVMPTRCGVYYGQCSEICGINHGFMPIVVDVVP